MQTVCRPGHSHHDCPIRGTYRCAACKRPTANHPAWAQDCPIRREEQARAAEAQHTQPIRFQEYPKQAPKPQITRAPEQSQTEASFTPTTQEAGTKARDIPETQESVSNIQTTQEWEREIEKALETQLQSSSIQTTQEVEREVKNTPEIELQILNTQIT
jgi:hypothetical protein